MVEEVEVEVDEVVVDSGTVVEEEVEGGGVVAVGAGDGEVVGAAVTSEGAADEQAATTTIRPTIAVPRPIDARQPLMSSMLSGYR